MEVKISWGVYIPPLNHVCIQNSKYEGLSHGSNSQKVLKKTKKSNETDFLSVIFINEFHLKITDPTDFFPVKASLFYFLSGYYN